MVSFSFAAFGPKRVANRQAFQREIDKALKRNAARVAQDLRQTTFTWKHKPKFTVKQGIRRGDLFVSVTTEDKRWGWINAGTRPHMIRARRAKFLRFQTGFTPKTRPGLLGSGKGATFGAWRQTKAVHHPGIKARRWSEKIIKVRQPQLVSDMNAALRTAARQR